MSKILYTITDEAPALATRSLLPIVRAFSAKAGINIESRDISLAARILAAFPDFLSPGDRRSDDLAELGLLATTPEANIIKLPNISASQPQLEEAIAELQKRGFAIPNYPTAPTNDTDVEIRRRYESIKGSAVNPVLREGNSDRRAPRAVKNYARKHPHSMGPWEASSETHVATMKEGDFRHTEQSVTVSTSVDVGIRWVSAAGEHRILKERLTLDAGEIMDAAVMKKDALIDFLKQEVADARERGLLFSLHLKATMMKVSDPIIFGHALEAYFDSVFQQYESVLREWGISSRNGLDSIFQKLREKNTPEAEEIHEAFTGAMQLGPDLAMVNSEAGVTNLHVPSDVIIDASMPAMIRSSGKMWDASGQLRDTKAVIPDSTYAGVYAATIDNCRKYGALDPRTIGTVPNVGLMAQKAEEYGSHDKTWEIPAEGRVEVFDLASGEVFLTQDVKPGDIWRMCLVKDSAVRNWVQLGADRARLGEIPAVFWLDASRPHDFELIKKVQAYLPEFAVDGLDIQIMSPEEATHYTLDRLRKGLDTLSVTGNVLRDYLTDLFPILEVGTSAKMLSIVPLMQGGGLFETGAGGSAPKHVEQFISEGHLRWDSLGEFLALEASLEHLGQKTNNPGALLLSRTLGSATERLLDERKSPSRKVHEIDNRGSHFFLSLFWAEELSRQNEDALLASTFRDLAIGLSQNLDQIWKELNEQQGQAVDIGGYYLPVDSLADRAMRPSSTFNGWIDGFAD